MCKEQRKDLQATSQWEVWPGSETLRNSDKGQLTQFPRVPQISHLGVSLDYKSHLFSSSLLSPGGSSCHLSRGALLCPPQKPYRAEDSLRQLLQQSCSMQIAAPHSSPRAAMREPAKGSTRSQQVKSAPVARTQGLPAAQRSNQ